MPAPNELNVYFDEMAVPHPIRARVQTLLQQAAELAGGDFDFVFLEDQTVEGNHQFINLACFRGNLYLDFPIAEPNWHPNVISITNIRQISFESIVSYDFIHANEASVMEIDVVLDNPNAGFTLKATGQNCAELRRLITTILMTRLVGGA